MPFPRLLTITAAGLTAVVAAATLSSCSIFEPFKNAWAVRYVVEATTADVGDSDIAYQSAPHRGAAAQTRHETATAYPWTADTTITDKDIAQIIATPPAGHILTCTIFLDEEKILDQKTGAPGKPVSCSATPPG